MIRLLYVILFLLPLRLFSYDLESTASREKPTICLNMIVKDESRVIKRCLDSVKPIIEYWVIVDTGSTDDTISIIKEHLKDIPGELYERPWKNFGENRSEAFDLAKGKGDYILFMDADDILEYEPDLDLRHLEKDQYNFWRGVPGFTYLKPQLVRGNLPWKWVGVTHEYLTCDEPHETDTLESIKYISCDGGARSVNCNKFLQNIKLLKEGLKQEPDNSRYVFYLAESYRDAGKKGRALECYQKRIDMGGWQEEVYWSMLQIGHLCRQIGLPSQMAIDSYLRAFHYRPQRPESIYYLAEMYNTMGEYQKAYDCIKLWEILPKPSRKDTLFNMDWIKEYGLLFQLSICSYYVGQYEEALKACDELLTNPALPYSWRQLTENNRCYPVAKITEMTLQGDPVR